MYLLPETEIDFKKMYLDKLILLRERKPVNDMYRKSFKLSTTPADILAVENVMSRYREFSELHIANLAPNLIQLEPISNGSIVVPNGWNQDRLSFIMSVAYVVSPTKKEFYFLTGYTDYYDELIKREINSINMIDPKMQFNINSITLIEELTSAVDGKKYYNFVKEFTIVKDREATSLYDMTLNDNYLMRPVDIMTRISDFGVGTNLTSEATEVAKDNINPLTFLQKTMNSITEGMALATDENATDEVFIANATRDMATVSENGETLMLSCPFILALYRVIGNTTKPSEFTMPNLVEVFGFQNVEHVTKLLLLQDNKEQLLKSRIQNVGLDNILESNSLDSNLQPTVENLIAMEFYYMITSLMFNKKVTSGIFVLSNHPVFYKQQTCQSLFVTSYFHEFFVTRENIEYMDIYMSRVMLPKLTQNGRLNVNISADVDLLGKTSIAINVEGGQTTVFRYNSSMDNNFTPVVTNASGIENAANDVSSIIDTIYTVR